MGRSPLPVRMTEEEVVVVEEAAAEKEKAGLDVDAPGLWVLPPRWMPLETAAVAAAWAAVAEPERLGAGR